VGLVRRFSSSDSGRGFLIFQWIIKNITRGDVTAYRLILALLHSIPVLYVFRKYSSDYLISLYLFVASGCHIGWMMNGLRQFLAVSIIMAATPLLLKKKYIPLIAVILLAATIHTSALIMLPVVFIVQGEPWNIKTLVFILLSIIMMYLFSTYTGLLDTALENTEYAGLMASAEQMGDDGTNSIRVLVNSIPMLLSFVGLGILKQKRNPLINICINMSIITSCLYLISMVTSGVMLGRLPIYTSLYSFILLPYVIKEIFTEASAKLVTVAMIVLYFMYYLYAYYGF
jgi:transmembrane protein EpsG